MSKKGHSDIIKRIRFKNHGSSSLDEVQDVKVESKVVPKTDVGYKIALDEFYRTEASSAEMKNLSDNVHIGIIPDGKRKIRSRVKRFFKILFNPFTVPTVDELNEKLLKQQTLNTTVALLTQRLLNLDKISNDILSNKLDQMELKYDALITEIVHKYLVNFTSDLVSRMDILYRRLDEGLITQEVDIQKLKDFNTYVNERSKKFSEEIDSLRYILGAQRKAFEEIISRASELTPLQKSTVDDTVSRMNDLGYLMFENRYRESSEGLKQRLKMYIPYFKGCKKILDLGCGRGEFLEVLRDAGIEAEGIDLNNEMVEICRSRGLKVQKADVIDYLQNKDNSYDGIFCSNLIEHMPGDQIMRLIDNIRTALKDRGLVVIETNNPESLSIFTSSFYLDLSHQKPVHPLGLEALLESNGFSEIEIVRFGDVEDGVKLEDIDLPDDMDINLKRCFSSINRNIQRLNNIIFYYQEYAVVAYKNKLSE